MAEPPVTRTPVLGGSPANCRQAATATAFSRQPGPGVGDKASMRMIAVCTSTAFLASSTRRLRQRLRLTARGQASAVLTPVAKCPSGDDEATTIETRETSADQQPVESPVEDVWSRVDVVSDVEVEIAPAPLVEVEERKQKKGKFVSPAKVEPTRRRQPKSSKAEASGDEETAPLLEVEPTTKKTAQKSSKVEATADGEASSPDEEIETWGEWLKKQDFMKMKMDELRELARDRDLKISGRKAELVERLTASFEAIADQPAIFEEEEEIELVPCTMVETDEDAQRVLDILMSLPKDCHHAIDTETRNWELGVSPYLCGEVICWSIYCGPDVDFGNGPRLWINNLDQKEMKLKGFVEFFKDYLEDPSIKKVFQNYAFDRAMFFAHGIRVAGFAGDTMHMARLVNTEFFSYGLQALGERYCGADFKKQKFSAMMKKEKAKTPEDLHCSKNPRILAIWIDYSAFDAVVTWELYQALRLRLVAMTIGNDNEERGTMMDFYDTYWLPFGDVLVDIEERGIYVDVKHLKEQEVKAEAFLVEEYSKFKEWLAAEWARRAPRVHELDAELFNSGSPAQMKQLLYGKKTEEVAGVSIAGLGLPQDLKAKSQTGAEVIERFAGKDPEAGECGTAEDVIGQAGCIGLMHRVRAVQTAKALSTFLKPLQKNVCENSRVHTSMNLHTRTGRLSSRNPNLQQMPALLNDRFEVRQAIQAAPGMKFIIADYGQLDLRVLAHASGCKKMCAALSSGVDIHSNTAVGMYPEIQEAIANGTVALEETPGVACVKDKFPSQRRNAKAVNFGIAYGLTAIGLSEQLKVSRDEAQDMIDKWYIAYPGVISWQRETIKAGINVVGIPYVETPRGRRRQLPMLRGNGNVRGQRSSHAGKIDFELLSAQRQASNSPVQGGSADIVVEAMLKASKDKEINELGYKMVLQVHDELIFEGPEEHSQQALAAVRRVMEHPFLDDLEFAVPLPVDAKAAQTWHDAKHA